MNSKATGSSICGECGSSNVEESWQDYTFPYGIGDKSVELSCKVPVKSCKDCGFIFIDGDAEDYCHAEVCRHLGVLPPLQIRSLRDLYEMTQAEFSAITKLGEATLSRWERGAVVQNQAYDNYLYLLGFSENMEKLFDRDNRNHTSEQKLLISPNPTFREIEVTVELKERQKDFELQPS